MRARKWLRDLPLLLGMIVSAGVVFSSTQVSGAPRPTLKPAPVVGGSSTVLNDTGPGSVREAPNAAATPKPKSKPAANRKPKPTPVATPKPKPTATPTPAATAAPTPAPTAVPTPTGPLDPVTVKGTQGKVVAGSVTFTMSATSHKPKVGEDWTLNASAMRSGSPISGRVRADALYQGAPVQDIDSGRLKAGSYSYHNAWPQQAVGYPLTIRLRVNAGGLEQVFLFDINVQGEPTPAAP